MKQRRRQAILCIFILIVLTATVLAAPAELVPVGRVVGIHLDSGVTVVDFEAGCDAQTAGLEKGDRILTINDTPVDSMEQVRRCVAAGSPVRLQVERGGKQMAFLLQPQPTEDGYRLGLRVRDGVTGIGTVTFYDPATGCFGALGHSVNEPESGTLLSMTGGSILTASVEQVRRGAAGSPGELQGLFAADAQIGAVTKNTSSGIFGQMQAGYSDAAPIPVAAAAEVQPGPAEIVSNVRGSDVCRYTVEILKLQPAATDGRNLLLRVTDSDLLTQTGGIVQGMGLRDIRDNTRNA